MKPRGIPEPELTISKMFSGTSQTQVQAKGQRVREEGGDV